jgi:hypothetical protein
MKATKAWSVAGLLVVAGLSSVSCGNDEGTNGNNGGSGSILTGGTGGSSAGTRAEGGSGGSTTAPNAKLGRACTQAHDCADPNFPDLTCITATDTKFANGAPPKGLCTMPCTLPTDNTTPDPCEALGTNAICYPFEDNATTGYCMEGCTFGAPALGDPQKCHGRAEFTCRPAGFSKTMDVCKVSTDCQPGELCSQGSCYMIWPACLPGCAGDIDCEDGMYCDQSYGVGTCTTKKQTGKALGEPCTVPDPNGPDEPDECLGWCAADDVGSTKGHCLSTCTFGAPCSYNSATQKFDGACVFASKQLLGGAAAPGDTGYCDLACNCSSECSDSTLDCELLPDGALSDSFRGAGLCFLADPKTSMPYDHCGAGGAGPDMPTGDAGGGGAPSAPSGAAGAAGGG